MGSVCGLNVFLQIGVVVEGHATFVAHHIFGLQVNLNVFFIVDLLFRIAKYYELHTVDALA